MHNSANITSLHKQPKNKKKRQVTPLHNMFTDQKLYGLNQKVYTNHRRAETTIQPHVAK